MLFVTMSGGRLARRVTAALWMVSAVAARAGELSFDEAQRLALAAAPTLLAAGALREASAQELRPAGELPDPQLALGVDNLPTEGQGRFGFGQEPMAMRRVALSQAFPNGDKRAARVAVAQGALDVSTAQEAIARLRLREQTALAWIDRYTAEQQLARIDALRAENRLFADAVRARLAGGAGAAMDAVVPRREAADIDALEDRFATRRAQATAELERWLGDAARAPLAGGVPDWPVDADHLRQHLPHHPELAIYEARAERARAEVALARSARHPDWGLAVAYEQRDPRFGDMVSVEVSMDLPLWPGRRQDPLIAARLADGEALAARQDALLREHRAVLEARLAEYARLERAVARQTGTLLPLTDEKVALALAAWRGSAGSLADLVAARRERIDTELDRIDLEGQRQQAAARLHFAYDVAASGDQP